MVEKWRRPVRTVGDLARADRGRVGASVTTALRLHVSGQLGQATLSAVNRNVTPQGISCGRPSRDLSATRKRRTGGPLCERVERQSAKAA